MFSEGGIHSRGIHCRAAGRSLGCEKDRAGCSVRSQRNGPGGFMLKKSVTLALLAIAAVAVAWALPAPVGQDAHTILSNVAKAMGADNLKTIQYSGTATEFAFGQAVNPSSPWPGFVDKSYMRTINYDMPGWRIDRVLADVPLDRRGGGLPPGPTQTVMVNTNTPWANQLD